jgi:hypothetical protein
MHHTGNAMKTATLPSIRVQPDSPLLRELLIPLGREGYVALFEIDDATTVTLLAFRHQREEDYH